MHVPLRAVGSARMADSAWHDFHYVGTIFVSIFFVGSFLCNREKVQRKFKALDALLIVYVAEKTLKWDKRTYFFTLQPCQLATFLQVTVKIVIIGCIHVFTRKINLTIRPSHCN